MNLFELAVVVSAVDRASSVLNGVKNAIGGATAAGKAMKDWGQQASVGGALMQGASQQIIGALGSIVQPANDVETALSQVSVALGDASSPAALARVQAAGITWSKAHKDTAKGYIDATNTMAQAGLNETQALAGANVALSVATATMGDGVKAADLLATLYNNVADKSKGAADEMWRLGDIVTKTQNVFQIKDLQQFSEGLKFAVPSAQAMGVSIEEVSAVIGTLNNAGLQGSMAGTAFSSTMAQMLKASKELRFEIARTAQGGVDFTGTIKNLERQFGSLEKWPPALVAQFQRTFGDEGFRGIALMLGKSDALAASLKGIRESAGATLAAQKILEGTRTASWAILTNQITALKVAVADQLTPALAAIMPHLTTIIVGMQNFVATHPDLTRMVVILAAILASVMAIAAPILLSVGAIGMFTGHVVTGAALIAKFGGAVFGLIPSLISATVAAWGFAAALLANPITWIVLAVVAAAALIYVYWDPIKRFFVALWQAISAAFVAAWAATVAAWDSAVAWFAALWSGIKAGFAAAWGAVVAAWDGAVAWFGGLLDGIKAGFSIAVDAVFATWGRVTGFFLGIWDNIKSAFQKSFVGGILTVLSYLSPIGLLIRAFTPLWPWLSGLPRRFLAVVAGIGAALVGAVVAARNTALTLLTSLWSSLQSGWVSMIAWFQELPGRIFAALSSLATTVSVAFVTARDRAVEIFMGAVTWYFSLPGRIFAALSSLATTISVAFVAARDRAIEIFMGAVTWYFSLPGRIFAALSMLPSLIGSVFAAVKDRVFGILSVVAAQLSGFFLNGIRNDLNAVIGWLSSFSLFDAGRNILRTLTDGILAAASGPIDAVMGVVQRIRNLLPFSPAKAGPLRDLHRIRLIETIAATVRAAPLVTAMSGATAMAVAAMPQAAATRAATITMAPVPMMAPMPARGGRGPDDGGTGPGEPPMQVTFQIAGNADASTVAQLERFVRDNAKLIHGIVKRQADLEKRGEFS